MNGLEFIYKMIYKGHVSWRFHDDMIFQNMYFRGIKRYNLVQIFNHDPR